MHVSILIITIKRKSIYFSKSNEKNLIKFADWKEGKKVKKSSNLEKSVHTQNTN